MTNQELIDFAIENIAQDGTIDMNDYSIPGISLYEEKSNDYVKVYIGEVFFKEQGDEVSSVFLIIVYKNGNKEFEWS